MESTARHSRRTMIGIVSSTKTQKTITVEVERTYKHAKYGKYLRRRKRYLAHDEESTARVGDQVEITSTRPLSKRKRWRLLRVVSRSQLGGVEWVDPTAQMLEDVVGRKPGAAPAGAEEGADGSRGEAEQ